MTAITPQMKIAAELELRRREREELKAELLDGVNGFMRFMEIMLMSRDGEVFIEGPHHRMIAEKLMQVYQSEVSRLIINMPPGFGKTEEIVIMFTAWCMAKEPRARFMHVTYSDDLCTRNSKFIKSTIMCDKYQELWPYEFEKDNNAAARWATSDGAEFYAAASGGQIIGFRAGRFGHGPRRFTGAMIIDDPIKPDDAESDTMRNDINGRIDRTIRSRLAIPIVPIIIVMQRLHDNDPCGYVLSQDNNEDWDVLSLPVISDDGIPLWPEKLDLDDIEVLRKSDKRVFYSQYMQKPAPDDGEYFKREDLREYDKLPDNLTYFLASDYAVTKGEGDFTEHGVGAIDPEGNLYLVDWWGGKEDTDYTIDKAISLCDTYGIKLATAETGVIQKAIEPYLRRRMVERKVLFSLEWQSHGGKDKQANARAYQAMWQANRVYFPKNTKWADDLLAQKLRFPYGKNDDKVDVLGLMGRLIDRIWTKKPIKQLETHKRVGNVITINDLLSLNNRKRMR